MIPSNEPDTSPLMDGFTLQPALQFLPYRYYPLALGGLEVLRRAALWHPRWFVIPDSINQPIQPYDTLEYQCSILGGSYLWGYQFTELSGGDVDPTAQNLLVQVTDACTGIAIWSDFVTDFALAVPNTGTALGAPVPRLLPLPRLILEPGLIDVEISNRTGNEVTCQLLLLCAEPCAVVGERGQG